MCLITTCPKGTKKRKADLESFIQNGMNSNTDGSGFAAKKNNVIILEKGFRSAVKLVEAIDALELTEEDELIIHHRIGTSGERNEVNMHPFIVSNDIALLKSVKGEFNLPVMAHNGVFGAFSDYKSLFSDTFHFIEYFMGSKDIIELLQNNQEKFEEVFKGILLGNRLAFLFPDMDMVRIGSYTEDNGYFHSNTGYKTYTYDKGGSSDHFRGKGYKVKSYNNEEGDELEPTYHVKQRVLPSTKGKVDTFLDEINAPIVGLFPNQNANKVLNNNICFKSEDLEVTVDNFEHFIFVPKYMTASGAEKNKGYIIESYDKNSLRNPISKYKTSSEIIYVSIKDFVLLCNIYVKNEHRQKYEGLKTLVDFTNRNHGKKVVNALRRILTKNFNNKVFTIKKFGTLRYEDMNFIYNKYKVIKTDELPIGEAIVGEDNFSSDQPLDAFTMHEHGNLISRN